jgi:hypothetical protein
MPQSKDPSSLIGNKSFREFLQLSSSAAAQECLSGFYSGAIVHGSFDSAGSPLCGEPAALRMTRARIDLIKGARGINRTGVASTGYHE